MRDAATVVMHVATEVRHENVWVGPHVVQLGPAWLPGGMPHRIDPGYFEPVSHTVRLAVLGDGTRIAPRSSMPGWSTGKQVCIPCRDARVRQRAQLQQSLNQLPARKRPVAPTPPNYSAIRRGTRRSSVVGWSLIWCVIFLGLGVSADVAFEVRSELGYYDFSEYDVYAALALESLLLGWLTAGIATAIRRSKTRRAAAASYRKQQRAYQHAAKEADDYEVRRAGVVAALAKLDSSR